MNVVVPRRVVELTLHQPLLMPHKTELDFAMVKGIAAAIMNIENEQERGARSGIVAPDDSVAGSIQPKE